MRRTSRTAVVRVFLLWSIPSVIVLLRFVLPWMRRIDLRDPVLSVLCHISATIWFVVLCWSWYHLVCQLSASFKRLPQTLAEEVQHRTRFVILYLTCDDFNETCCVHCMQQDYPVESYRVLICDDSKGKSYRKLVEDFCDRHKVAPFRRRPKTGFKAGNLNAAFRDEICRRPEPEEWVVIVDADQTLPPDYLGRLDVALRDMANDVAFVQTMNRPEEENPNVIHRHTTSTFQRYFGLEVDVFYHRDVVARMDYGFLPLLGHGCAVRTSAWRTMGGFPAAVSEDFAFSVRVANMRSTGTYAPEVVSYEAYPRDFSAFVVRLMKFAAGTAELFRSRETREFLLGCPGCAQLDFVLLLAWYPLMPLVLANIFLSTYVCHRLDFLGLTLLHPLLPYFFLLMFGLNLCVFWTVAPFQRAATFWFRCVALYQSTIPAAAYNFVRYAFSGARPPFLRTPKEDARPRHGALDVCMPILGVFGLCAALRWRSPFSFVLASHSVAHVFFPLFRWLNVDNLRGVFARTLIFLPGALLIVALFAMWASAKFSVELLRGFH